MVDTVRSRFGLWWVLGTLLCLFVLVPLAVGAFRSVPRAPDGLPQRISVHQRDYRWAGPLTDAQVSAERGEWTSLGRVPSAHAVVYDVDRVPGMTVMGLVVERSPGRYVAYSLIGGP